MYSNPMCVLQIEKKFLIYTEKDQWSTETDTAGSTMLQSTILGDEIVENDGNDDIVITSLLEAFRRHCPILTDEVEQQQKDALHDLSCRIILAELSIYLLRQTWAKIGTKWAVHDCQIPSATMKQIATIAYLAVVALAPNSDFRYLKSAENQFHDISWQSFYKNSFQKERSAWMQLLRNRHLHQIKAKYQG